MTFLTFYLLVSSTIQSKAENYIPYFKQVNQARILIAQKKIDSAFQVYQAVFKTYPKHFYRDVHNACACAIRLKKWDAANLLVRELIAYGYQKKDFENPAFTSFKTSTYWRKIMQEYPSLRKKYEQRVYNYQYKKHLQMNAHDQSLCRINDYEEHNKAIYEFTSLVKLDYEQNGIPVFCRYKDRMNSGYQIFYRHLFGKRGRALISRSYDYVQKLDSLKIKELLAKEVEKGNLSPRFVVTAESYFENEYGENTEIQIRIDYINETVTYVPSMKITYPNIPPYPHVDFTSMDKNRLKFGMNPLAEEVKLFMVDTWRTKYPFKEIKERLKNSPKSTIEDVKKMVQEIEKKYVKSYKAEGLQESFFLTNYYSYKHTKYIGLEKYVTK